MKVKNRVCYTIYNSRTAEHILMIFSFFGFVLAPNYRITIKKIGKVKKNIIFRKNRGIVELGSI